MNSPHSCPSGPRSLRVAPVVAPIAFTAMLVVMAGLCADSTPLLATRPASPPPALAGAQRDATSAAISADGRLVVFQSAAGNLADPTGVGGVLDLWVRDRVTGTTTRATVNRFGPGGGDADSGYATLTQDGRYLAFESRAANLVTNPVSGAGDVYLRDLQTATTWLVSGRPNGAGGSGPSRRPFVSPDGQWVLFESDATNLLVKPVAANGVGNVYLYDRLTGQTRLVSAQPITGTASAVFCRAAGVSADGRFQLFAAATGDLVRPTQSLTKTQAILHDRDSGTNRYVALNPTGAPVALTDSRDLCLSRDGDIITFTSSDASINPAFPGQVGLFWRNLGDGTLNRIAGNANRPFGYYELAPDGQHVGFTQTNQVFVWDAHSLTNTLVSVTTNGTMAVGISRFAGMSDDGARVVFLSNAPDLVDGPASSGFQTYLRDVVAGVTIRLSARADGTPAVGDTHFGLLSGDGRVAVFEGSDTALVDGLMPFVADVFARELPGNAVELVSSAASTTPAPTAPLKPSFVAASQLSSDGRLLLFASDSDELVSGDANHASDVFLRDLRTGATTLVSVDATGSGSGSGPSTFPVMSADARWVVFVSRATNLTAESRLTYGNVFLRDMVAGVTQLISNNSAGWPGGSSGDYPLIISPSGAYVAFIKTGTDPNLANTRVLIHETATGKVAGVAATTAASNPGLLRLLAVGDDASLVFYSKPNLFVRLPGDSLARPVSTAAALLPAASPDARAVAFWGDINTTTYTLRLYDAVLRSNLVLASFVGLPSPTAEISLSDNARCVAFTHDTASLDAADTNGVRDVYLIDRADTNVVELISRNAAGTAAANGASDHPRLSADGRFVVFRSRATDLVEPPLARAGARLYVRDRQAGTTRLLSADEESPVLQPTVGGAPPLVALVSEASDLVPGDFNGGLDLFTVPLISTPPLVLTVQLLADGSVALSWPDGGAPGYRVEFKPTLASPSWQVLAVTIESDPGGHHRAVDPGPSVSGERYYRVVALP